MQYEFLDKSVNVNEIREKNGDIWSKEWSG